MLPLFLCVAALKSSNPFAQWPFPVLASQVISACLNYIHLLRHSSIDFSLTCTQISVSLLKCKVVNIFCLVFSVFTCSSYSPWTSQVKKKKKAVNIGDTRVGFNPCVRKILWSRKCQPVPAFMPGKPLDEEPGGLYSTGSQRFGHN